MLTAKFQDLDNQGSTANYDIIEKENQNLKARVNEMQEKIDTLEQGAKDSELASQVEERYLGKLEEMSEELGKLKAENSEMKARQLMSQFQS